MSSLLRALTIALTVLGLVLGFAIGDDVPNGKKKPTGDTGIIILPNMMTRGGQTRATPSATFNIVDILDGLKIKMPASMGSVAAQVTLPGTSVQVQFAGLDGTIFFDGQVLRQFRDSNIAEFNINVVGSNGACVKMKLVFGALNAATVYVY